MPLGQHVLIELWECEAAAICRTGVRAALLEAVEAIGATLIHEHVHAYSPYGITALAVLAESHLAIHTWPECGYVAADVFTCGETTDPQAAVSVLCDHFSPAQVEVRVQPRGVLDTQGRSAAFGPPEEPSPERLSRSLEDTGQ